MKRRKQVTKVDEEQIPYMEEQIPYMDQCRYRLQLELEDADEEWIMMGEDAMAAAGNDDDINLQEYDDGNNNNDIEGEEYAMQMLLGLASYRD